MKVYFVQRRRKPVRSGFSLIEAVGVIVVLGMIMSLSGIAMYRITQTQKLVLRSIRHTKVLEDLHNRLLIDTRAAIELKVVNGTTQLLDPLGQTVEYTQDAGWVKRTTKSKNSESPAHTRWEIGVRQMQVELDTSGTVPLAKYSLKFDRLLEEDWTPSVQAEVSTNVESAVWISRLGVELP